MVVVRHRRPCHSVSTDLPNSPRSSSPRAARCRRRSRTAHHESEFELPSVRLPQQGRSLHHFSFVLEPEPHHFEAGSPRHHLAIPADCCVPPAAKRCPRQLQPSNTTGTISSKSPSLPSASHHGFISMVYPFHQFPQP
ncbi:hypothetical protein AAHA92_29047 [Salvia divinorum]|uniref:Uncharacterized protein n=1 Tax=Salvia divinorum TaxID=28513 RepID=A0ABD1FX34_SALDI